MECEQSFKKKKLFSALCVCVCVCVCMNLVGMCSPAFRSVVFDGVLPQAISFVFESLPLSRFHYFSSFVCGKVGWCELGKDGGAEAQVLDPSTQ